MPHDGYVGTTPSQLEPSPRLESQPNLTQHEAVRASFTTNAVEKIFGWLAFSPNNPDYLESDTHRKSTEWLESHLAELVLDIANRSGNVSATPGSKAEAQPTSVYEAMDMLYGDARETIEEMYSDTEETNVADINRHAVRALGALIMRAAYYGNIFAKETTDFNEHDSDTRRRTLRQNIVATVLRTARLEKAASQTSAQSPARLDAEPVEAAA